MRVGGLFPCVLCLLYMIYLSAAGGEKSPPTETTAYSTWGGVLEADKCASAWVIKRFAWKSEEGEKQKGKGKSENGKVAGKQSDRASAQVTSGPVFKFFPPGTVIKERIQFDTPGATKYARQPGKTVMETIIWVHKLEDPALLRVARIVRDIEINKWGDKITPEATGLEAIINGLNKISKDEYECLERSSVIFDALYAEFKISKKQERLKQ